jgi:phthiocerol/phthiodiolone dimycocerosyl transferase-like enzyme/condensation domain-containing protein
MTERPLGALEKRFWLLDRVNANHLVLLAEIEGSASTKQWQYAIAQVQRRHPLLNVSISYRGDGTIHFVQRSAPIPIDEVEVRSCWDDFLARELSRPFDTTVAPLVRLGVANSDGRTTIILAAHHAVVDGMAAVTIINDITAALNGTELRVLQNASSSEEVIRAPKNNIPVITMSKTESGKLGEPNPDRGGIPPAIQRVEFSEHLTGKIRGLVKAKGTTVQGALCAACSIAAQKDCDISDNRPLTIVSPIDVKRRFGISGVVGVHLAANVLAVEIVDAKNFWEVANKFSDEIARSALAQAIDVQSQKLEDLFVGNDLEAAVELLIRGRARDVMVTNIGVVPNGNGDRRLQLRRLWGPLAFSGHPGEHTVGAVTVQGHLTICVGSRSMIPEFANTVVQTLGSQCGLQISMERGSCGVIRASEQG